ncbi:MAG: hypothetical protein NWF05_01665 [Candidatus Bathyarchaeota archaeon]|nr:hypothetical protein [Candidatus Bathyarchaeota archaeon]
MGAILNKMPNRETPKFRNSSHTYVYKRRVHDVRSPCQWLTHCDNGKCPAFTRINGNFYCVREGIP